MEAGSDRDPATFALAHVSDLYDKMGRLMIPISDLRGVHAFVEDFMLRYARKVEREACIRYGRLLESLSQRGAVEHRVRPQEWKRALGLEASAEPTERKERSWAMAKEMFPGFDFQRADLAEAALIAEYGRRHLANLCTNP
jgi:hypothetical protein